MSDAAHIEKWLLAQPGWVKGADLCAAMGITRDRELRTLGDVPGLVSESAISHSRKGYRHYLKATTREWLQFKHGMQGHCVRQWRRISRMQARRSDQRQLVLL